MVVAWPCSRACSGRVRRLGRSARTGTPSSSTYGRARLLPTQRSARGSEANRRSRERGTGWGRRRRSASAGSSSPRASVAPNARRRCAGLAERRILPCSGSTSAAGLVARLRLAAGRQPRPRRQLPAGVRRHRDGRGRSRHGRAHGHRRRPLEGRLRVSSSLTRSTALASGCGRRSRPRRAGPTRPARPVRASRRAADVTATKQSGKYESLRVDGLDSRPVRAARRLPDARAGHPARLRVARRRQGGFDRTSRVYRRCARRESPRALQPGFEPRRGRAARAGDDSVRGHASDDARRLRPRRTVRSSWARACASCASSPTPTTRGRTSSCAFFRDTTLVAVSPDVGFTPEPIQYAPTGGVPAGDYFVRRLRVPGGAPLDAARTYTARSRIDDTPAPTPYLARWQVFPANPPLPTLPGYPWNNPSTDTRELWCWDGGDAADCDRVVGNLASRAPWDYDLKANAPTLHDDRQQRQRRPSRGRHSRSRARRSTGRRARPGTTRSRGRTPGSTATATRPRRRSRHRRGTISAAVTNLFVAHNRMHDFGVLPRASPSATGTPRTSTSA